jgi:hypothetical protein
VRHLIDALLLREAREFALRFACTDCVNFDAEGSRCVHGYTERPSKSDLELDQAGGFVTFCKEFELT